MLKSKLLQDFKEAMKSKNLIAKNTIQLLRASILNKEKDLQVELSDEDIQQIVASEIKKRNETIALYENNNQTQKVQELNEEINVLKTYLPKPLTQSELLEIIQDIINECGASSVKDMGRVVKLVKAKVGASSDGKTISELVRKQLGGN